MQVFLNTYLKMFFLLTPFFVVTMFLAMTGDLDARRKHKLALKVTMAVIVTCLAIYLFGRVVFNIFGITLDAFRIGAGVLLFLSAISLVQSAPVSETKKEGGDISVVPLAIPITVGPATTGTLLVMGAEPSEASTKFFSMAALLCATLSIGILLYTAGWLERLLGQTRLTILSKLTGLILASIAAQMIFTGIQGFMG
jgi:multiple antibiotic resistance protein